VPTRLPAPGKQRPAASGQLLQRPPRSWRAWMPNGASRPTRMGMRSPREPPGN
jgi:hypothetical protein